MELNRRPNPQDQPVLYCRCGAGVCSILRSPRNRLFYLCPAILPREDCGFFKWCDEVSAPLCRCGAGRCSIRTHPFAGRQYFACPMEESCSDHSHKATAMDPSPSTPTKNPTPNQYDEALSERMKADTFHCKNQGHWARDCPLRAMEPNPSTPTKNPTVDQYGEALLQRMKADTCFHCKNQGHWARDCPLKSHPSPSNPPRIVRGNVPVVQCPCGAGACAVRTSGSELNPNRQYYKCSLGRCKFFEWCDQVKAPMCPCGAGRCTVKMDPDRRRRYFFCRIKEGHGACSFFQWEDYYVKDNLASGKAVETLPDRMEIELSRASNAEDCPELVNTHQDPDLEELLYGSNKIDEILLNSSPVCIEKSPDMKSDDDSLSPQSVLTEVDELSVDEADLLDHVTQRTICRRQREFMNQIDAAAEELNGGISPSFNVMLSPPSSNLVFLPSRRADEQHIRLLAGLSCSENNSVDQAPCCNCNSLLENNSAVFGENCIKILRDAVLNLQRDFISRLDLIKPSDLEIHAKNFFQLIESIPPHHQHQEFKSRVKGYINSALALSKIDEDPTFKDLLERHLEEKRRFEEVSALYREKKRAQEAKEDEVKELWVETSRLREMLSRKEEELAESLEECLEIEQDLVEINQQMKRARNNMEVADQEVDEVRRQREAERAAAKAAVDRARALLSQ